MATQPRPLGNKARAQVETVCEHLRNSRLLIADAIRLSDRNPDTAAAHIAHADKLILISENILLLLRLGEFTE